MSEQKPSLRSRRTKDEVDAPQDEATQDAKSGTPERGTFSPAQHDDDGWGGLPVQMRG